MSLLRFVEWVERAEGECGAWDEAADALFAATAETELEASLAFIHTTLATSFTPLFCSCGFRSVMMTLGARPVFCETKSE